MYSAATAPVGTRTPATATGDRSCQLHQCPTQRLRHACMQQCRIEPVFSQKLCFFASQTQLDKHVSLKTLQKISNANSNYRARYSPARQPGLQAAASLPSKAAGLLLACRAPPIAQNLHRALSSLFTQFHRILSSTTPTVRNAPIVQTASYVIPRPRHHHIVQSATKSHRQPFCIEKLTPSPAPTDPPRLCAANSRDRN